MNRVLIFLTFLFFLSTSQMCIAQLSSDPIRIDSSDIRMIQVDSAFFEQYTSDSDFDYASDISPIHSNFWSRLIKFLEQSLDLTDEFYKGLSFILKLLMWLTVISILIFVATKLKFHRLFYSEDAKQDLDFKLNIQKKDFNVDKEIGIELKNKNYRNALRLQFIRIVQELNEKDIISFSIEKTNYDYLKEIKNQNQEFFQPFKRLIRIYNSVWYGHYEIQKQHYSQYSMEFDQFKNNLDA